MLSTATEPLAQRRPYPSALAALVWGHLANDALANYLPGILPLIALQRHVPLFLLSSLMTILMFGQMLQPLSGLLADRIGGRALVLGGPLLSVAGVVLVSLSRSYGGMAIGLLLAGVGTTLFHPQAIASARRLAGSRVGLSMSVFLVGGEFGRAIGPLVATLLAGALGLDHLWLVGLGVVVTWPWLLRVVPKLPARPAASAPVNFRQHLWPAVSLGAFAGLRAGAILTVVTLIPVLWHREGGSYVLGASLVTTMIGIGIVGNLVGGMMRDKLGSATVLWGSSVIGTLLLAALQFVQGAAFWPILALLGIALFSTAPVTTLIGQDIFKENPALGSGIALGLGNGLGAVLVLPIGYAAQHISIAFGLGLGAALLVLAFLSIGPLLRATGEHRTA
ncbi:MAG: MFS transporter [Thermaerobacter sp.]|nr:MFS transporter [Thermaerobacter sp.]